MDIMRKAASVVVGNIGIACERFGADSRPAILLIMGLGAQMIRWPAELCGRLVGAGFHVIRFDNRDCGLSSHMDDAPVPDVVAALRSGRIGSVPYTLDDMAADCAGLLDALSVSRAHIVGASMGGAIGQVFAATFPERALSFTSIMSSSGNPLLPPPTPEAWTALVAPLPRARDRASIVADAMARQAAIASPAFPTAAKDLRALFETEYERGFNPRGVARQLAAIVASGDRRPLLRRIQAPTVVLHGEADPLVPLACGEDVARNIPGARFESVPGMGHDFPAALASRFAEAILGAAAQAAS